MAGTGKTSAALAKLACEREAVAAQAAALDMQEKEMRKALAAEGAPRLALGSREIVRRSSPLLRPP